MRSTTVYSIAQINNQLNHLLDSNFDNVFIKGEVSSFSIYSSGHAYFTIKDQVNEMNCVFFNYNKSELKDIKNLEVILYGKLNIYKAKGRLQFIVSNINLDGEGTLWNKYLKLKNSLESEGLFDMKYKKKLPYIPEKIAIISSKQGAVIHDILNILNRRSPYISAEILDVSVQGENSAKQIVSTLKTIHKYDYDLIILARGGGSLEDLMSFNNEEVIRSIFECGIPIISAIGHETDFTLSDFVSDKRAATPSEAAEICAPDIETLRTEIFQTQNKLSGILNSKLDSLSKLLESIISKLLLKNPLHKIEKMSTSLLHNKEIIKNLFSSKISSYKIDLEKLKIILYQHNVHKIREKGFVVLKKNNKIVSNINDLQVNDSIKILMNNGKVSAKIDKLYNE